MVSPHHLSSDAVFLPTTGDMHWPWYAIFSAHMLMKDWTTCSEFATTCCFIQRVCTHRKKTIYAYCAIRCAVHIYRIYLCTRAIQCSLHEGILASQYSCDSPGHDQKPLEASDGTKLWYVWLTFIVQCFVPWMDSMAQSNQHDQEVISRILLLLLLSLIVVAAADYCCWWWWISSGWGSYGDFWCSSRIDHEKSSPQPPRSSTKMRQCHWGSIARSTWFGEVAKTMAI